MTRLRLGLGASLALALAGSLVPPAAAEDNLSVEGYARSLEELQRLLDEQALGPAQAAARELRSRSIDWHGETLAPDASVLDAVAEAITPEQAARAGRRLGRLSSALRQLQAAAAVDAHPELLARLTPVDPLRAGGGVATLRVKPLTLPQKIEAAVFAVSDWVASSLRQLRAWLSRLRPARAPRQSAPGATAVTALAFALVVVLVLSVLIARRRRSAPLPAAEPGRPLASRRDADPLSREASEWEQHAAELAAAHRWREAIRAWYHAVLVALFRQGLLQHQKGRTNWEYAARLAPALAWRPAFLELTSLFDREWYGRRTSDAEALAQCARTARGLLSAVRGARGEQ